MRLRRKGGQDEAVRLVLVATDRSETAERAVRFAAEMAERYEAELLVLRVLAGDDGSRGEAARRERADVLVVGSVGMSGRREFLLRNVPNRVSHNAPCTVVIVQTHREDA